MQLIGNPSKSFSFDEYASEKSKYMLCDTVIYDLRGKTAAFGNKFKGKGFESSMHYTNCEVCFEDIPNIHAVRDAFQQMVAMAEDGVGPDNKEGKNYHSAIGKSGWLNLLGDILHTANRVKKSLHKGYSVLLHCSDGWDRTSQVSALVQLLMTNHYRTLLGFCQLFEKEFVRY